MRKTLSDKGVATIKPRAARYAYADPELRGHYVRVQPSGAKSLRLGISDSAPKPLGFAVGCNRLAKGTHSPLSD